VEAQWPTESGYHDAHAGRVDVCPHSVVGGTWVRSGIVACVRGRGDWLVEEYGSDGGIGEDVEREDRREW